ncbi:MAG: amino acid ABC transporter permease [Asticcacaulis sp.]
MNLEVITDNLGYFFVGAWPDGPVAGVALTIFLSLTSGIISAVLGLVGGVGLTLLSGQLKTLLQVLLTFFRAIPVIMLIFWVYFLGPLAFGLDVPAIGAVVAALSLIGGAYLSHSVHAGIEALPKGQWQAASAMGLTKWQALRLVILPQALPAMAPSFINQWVSLIKDTSLAYVIGVAELSFVATQINNREIAYPAEIFLFAGLVYFVICTLLEALTVMLAKHHRRYAL